MRIAAGERRAVLGSNGAGKTTLFNAITGDFMPTAGRIRFFGEDITDLPPHERIRRGLRRTYQISQLFGGLSVRDNVYLACRGVSRRRFSLLRPRIDDVTMAQADSILHAVHLEGDRDRLVGDAEPRPAAPARNRAGAGGCAALHPVRRACGRSVADRAARSRRDPERPAEAYRLHHHRARSRRGAARLGLRLDDAQRTDIQGRHAGRDRGRPRGAGHLSRGPAMAEAESRPPHRRPAGLSTAKAMRCRASR